MASPRSQAWSNASYNAVKSVYSGAKVVVHLANGYDTSDFTWFFAGLKAAGGKWDIVGTHAYHVLPAPYREASVPTSYSLRTAAKWVS
jgi:arabinogalactan endo-1,4-beta-galactosidase